MRLGLLILAIVLCVPSTGHALRLRDVDSRHSPLSADLPLRGSIFIVPLRYRLPNVRWVRGNGTITKKSLGLVARLDYVADGDALLEVDGDQLYTITTTARPPRMPRSVSLHRDDAYCGDVSIALDAPVAGLKARLTRGDRVEDYWLADALGMFRLEPACDPDYASMSIATLELYVVLADGRERSLLSPIAVQHIPIHDWSEDDPAPIDWRWLAALLVALSAFLAERTARPDACLHGLTAANYAPKLRFRIRLPRARIVRR
jgi:hypothetical protein